MTYFVYILRCADQSLYTGMTSDVRRRLEEHQAGLYSEYTHHRRPVTLIWSQSFPTHLEAFQSERRIKGWTRAKKEALAAGDWDLLHELAQGPRKSDRVVPDQAARGSWFDRLTMGRQRTPPAHHELVGDGRTQERRLVASAK